MKAQNEKIFSELKDRYDFPPSAKRIRIILDRIYGKKYPSILDGGCGTGWVSCFLQKVNIETVMLDLSNEKLLKCLLLKSKHLLSSPLIRGTVTRFPFKDETFDLCLFMDVIEHVPNLSKCMSEIWRVLAWNGKLFLTTPNKFGAYTVLYDILGKKLFGEQVSDHVHYFSIQSLRSLLHSHGFLIEGEEKIEFLSPLFYMASRSLKYRKKLICRLSQIDVLLSDYLPKQFVSEWFITACKTKNLKALDLSE